MFTRRAFWCSGAAVLAMPSISVAAQPYPMRLIKLVVPSPAGGPHEVIVRTLADRMSASLGQPVIVENLPGGAGGSVGTKLVATPRVKRSFFHCVPRNAARIATRANVRANDLTASRGRRGRRGRTRDSRAATPGPATCSAGNRRSICARDCAARSSGPGWSASRAPATERQAARSAGARR